MMAPAANRARREHVVNALFVVAAIEAMPPELTGIAERLTVLFPWGSLLRGVARGEGPVLATLARVATPGATLDVVINQSAAERTPVEPAAMMGAYESTGFRIERLESVTPVPFITSWAKRVAHHTEVLHMHARRGS
jgi:16S rRNA (adenine(1408)-N(1))-methyltransferase